MIDHGNSGTGVRLVMGAMATTDITATFTGDASLRGAADGADHRAPGALRRRGARAARRAAADHADRRGEPDAGAVHDAGALGAGEVGGAARRAERARRDGGDREGADARPHRADARRLRRDGPYRGDRRGPRDHPARPAGAARAGDRGAARPEFGRLSGGGRAAGRGVGHPGAGDRAEPDARGPLRHAGRDGRGHRLREPARGGGRAGRRSAGALRGRSRGSRCRRSGRPR